MNRAIIRSVRGYQPSLLSCSTTSNYKSLISLHRVSGTSGNFRQVATACNKPESMDKKPNDQIGRDAMSDSFGEAYATRCDEEGFGGIYGGNQSKACKDLEHDEDKEEIHENHPDYDKTQGSEVKEKEKAHHQKDANS